MIFSDQDKLQANGLKPKSHVEEHLTSILSHAINVVLSEKLIQIFKTVNDLKTITRRGTILWRQQQQY
jgi:hypothetical protein